MFKGEGFLFAFTGKSSKKAHQLRSDQWRVVMAENGGIPGHSKEFIEVITPPAALPDGIKASAHRDSL